MADRSNYYYLKIKEDFYNSEDMKLLESQDNGYIYSNILMKMYLLSLKNGGKLMYKDKIPYNSKMLSTILNHNADILDKAIMIFQNLGLIEILDSGAIFMTDIQNYIGKSSDEADRKRAYRARIESEKLKEIEEIDTCQDKCRTDCSNIKDRDKDRDKVRNKDRDKDRDKNNLPSLPENLDIEFDYLWKLYPNKQGKNDAKQKYFKFRKSGIQYQDVLNGLNKYLKYIQLKKIPIQYIKHGSTWFNQKCWEDEYETSNNEIQGKRDEQNELLKGVYDGQFKIN